MAKSNVTDWDTTAGNNTDVGGISIAENWPPENVNNAARETMAQLAAFHGDITGKLTSAGAANAYTLTTNDGIAVPAAGARYTFIANHANTGAATLAVNGGAAKSILKNHDVALAGGEIEVNQLVEVAFEATNDAYLMLSQPAATKLEVLNVDNIQIDGNTISSTNTNGNIILSPDGTGDVLPGADGTIDFGAVSTIWAVGYFQDIEIVDATPRIGFTDTTNNSDCIVTNENGDLILSADQNAEAVDSDIEFRVDGQQQGFYKNGAFKPASDNDIDIGTSTELFKTGYFHDFQLTDTSPAITFTDTTDNADCRVQAVDNGSLQYDADINNEALNSLHAFYVDGTRQLNITDGTIEPQTDNDIDLGAATKEYKDLYIDGTANIDTLTLTSGASVTAILDEDDMVSNSATALATQQSIKAYVDNRFTRETSSATLTTFTSLAPAKLYYIVFNEASLTGTNDWYIRLGDAGGVEATGYLSTSCRIATAVAHTSETTAFHVDRLLAADVTSGILKLANISGNVWIISGVLKHGTTQSVIVNGSKTLTATLDRIQILASGADTMDAGSVTVLTAV